MKHRYSEIPKSHQEFYYYLGLISTKFAILEHNILNLLGKLIVDDFIVTDTILERNSLSQNIELIKKINKHRRFEEKTIEKLIVKISNIRNLRNLFIHGIWSQPFSSENELTIICSNPRIKYEELKGGRQWTSQNNIKFQLSYLKKQVDNIDEILLAQDYLKNKLENLLLKNNNWNF